MKKLFYILLNLSFYFYFVEYLLKLCNKEQLFLDLTCCDTKALCYHFQFKWLLSVFNEAERNAYLTTTIIDLNIVGRKNLQIFIDDIKPTRLSYASFDLSKQMIKWLKDKTEETIIRVILIY